MKIVGQIQAMPEKERKQLFIIILLGVFVIMVGAWVVLGQLSPTQDDKTKETLFQSFQDKVQSAKAGFGDNTDTK